MILLAAGSWVLTPFAKILKVVFYGPTSLRDDDVGTRSGPPGAAQHWGLTEVTFGSIAFAAIIVRPANPAVLSFILTVVVGTIPFVIRSEVYLRWQQVRHPIQARFRPVQTGPD